MDWVIADLHGCFYTLKDLLRDIVHIDRSPSLVFVGDYFDRGLHSQEVVGLVIGLQMEGAICLRGNHDDVVDYLLNDHSVSDRREWVVGKPSKNKVLQWWIQHGFIKTLFSYSVYDEMGGSWIDEFVDKVPEEHKKFVRDLRLYWENDTHFVGHAYYDPGSELPRDTRFIKSDRDNETLWGRFPDNILNESFQTAWDKIGVFGHTPTARYGYVGQPISVDNLRLIDCGVAMGNGLCAYCCQQDRFLVVDTDKRDLE